jgi:hypothetical protein
MTMLTRAEMKREAFDVHSGEIVAPTSADLARFCMEWGLLGGECLCPSILLSEAHRPIGHDGDGTDEL